MSYELRPEKDAGGELARIIAEETGAVVRILKSPGAGPFSERIHRSRVGLKRIRAALSLARPEMRKFCKRQDALYRDAGRKLSAWRDAEVLVETLDKVQQKFASQVTRESLSSLHGVLVRRKNRAFADRFAVESILNEAAVGLSKGRKPLSELRVLDSICPGITADYRRARKAFLHAYQYPEDVSFHEWRKSVKRYLYQIEMVEKSLPESWKHHRKSIKNLADLLGEDHNLAVLSERLPGSASSLAPLLHRWQKEIRAEAATLGAESFGEKTRRFGKLFEKIWSRRGTPIDAKPFLVHRASA